MTIVDLLYSYQDTEFAKFQSKIIPSTDGNFMIGVRVPRCRIIAKKICNTVEAEYFLKTLPHKYFEENILHSLLISEIKDYSKCIENIDRFLPCIDNWAVCDILSPKIFKKHKQELLIKIKEWVKSTHPYTIRFGIEMLMSHFLDTDFNEDYFNLIYNLRSDEYYVNMMISWYFATALAKQYNSAIKVIEDKKLDKWCHNKTIQKAIESFRITKEQKDYLRSLRIK